MTYERNIEELKKANVEWIEWTKHAYRSIGEYSTGADIRGIGEGTVNAGIEIQKNEEAIRELEAAEQEFSKAIRPH